MSNFKIDGALYEQRKNDLQQIIDHFGPSVVLDDYSKNPVRTTFNLFEKIWFDRKSQDTHPAYAHGRDRILPYDESFEMYPNDCNDDHIKTMIKRALYEILPEAKNIDRARQAPSPGM